MQDLVDNARARIQAAATAEELEAVRVEVLGRKGVLTQLSKDMGKLPAEERASRGKFINDAKHLLEGAYDGNLSGFRLEEEQRRFKAEWLDLTVPATGVKPGSLHPVT